MCRENWKISVPYESGRKMGSENSSKISVPYESGRKMGSENRSKISLLSNNDNGSSLEMKEKDDKVEGTKIVKVITVITVITVVAGLGLAAALGISKLFGSSDSDGEKEPERNKETMAAPGRRGHRIYRDDFERDPADYFRKLRLHK